VNADTGNRLRITEFGRALQLRIRNRADDQEVLGERKRKGSRYAVRTQKFANATALRWNPRLRTRFQERHPRPSARLSDPCAPSRPIRKKWVSGLRAGRGHMVRLLACAGASSQARGNSQRANRGGREDHPLVDASVRCMQLQKSFGRASGSRCRPALSVGRRRDLAFGSLTPPSNRIQKVGGKKGSEKGSRAKACGVADRERARKSIQARLQRLVVGGGSCWHLRYGTRLKSFGSRRGTK
jgi:hypothetical protein